MEHSRRQVVDSSFEPVDGRCLLSFGFRLDAVDLLRDIESAFRATPLAHLIVFASPTADFAKLIGDLHAGFDCPVIGCTSAGEIAESGFVEDHLVVIGLPARHFAAKSILIENLDRHEYEAVNDQLIQDRLSLASENPDKPNGFSFLMVDGLSRCEDQLVSAISPSLAGAPLFGGSAGDALRFKRTLVAFEGEVHENAATLTQIVTDHGISVFSINHMTPGKTRMVVTEAQPQSRIVCGINDEPAAAEYARLIGKDPNQLDEFTFAENPVTVRVGDEYHVRAIQRVNEEGHLVFFSAIDEGMVLTVAQAMDMAEHLEDELARVISGQPRADILACDCFLRRIEAQKSQTAHKVNQVFQKYGVVGFSTYGEQVGPLHVNHTLTGVALFPSAPGG